MLRRLALAATAVIALSTCASAAEVAISCGAVGLELDLCKSGAEAWAKDDPYVAAGVYGGVSIKPFRKALPPA